MAYITVKEVNTYDFNDLMRRCWSGAIDTLKEIEKHDKEEEFMDYLENVFWLEEEVDLTDLNDFIWFENETIFEDLGINEDEEDEYDDEEEDEEDEEE